MMVSWDEGDIKPGRVIHKVNCDLTGSWMIGYRWMENDQFRSTVYGLVSMADGLFKEMGPKSEVVKYLNENQELLPLELTDMIIEFGAPDD